MSASAIPAELREPAQWIRYKLVPDGSKKPRKVPICPSDPGCASSTDPTTWGPYDVAHANVGKDETVGAGYVFAGDGIFGVDIDNCVVNRVVTERAKVIVAAFGTYTEISPSGEGLHVIGRGSLNGHRGLNRREKHNGIVTGGIEAYSVGRYFAMTGQHLMGTPLEITDGQVALDALVAKLDPPRPVPAPSVTRPRTSDDRERLVERARAYVSKMPAAISGQGGHEATFRVAIALVKGFSLDTGTALDLLREYNARCEPPWSEKELLHKIESAVAGIPPDGYILERDEPKAYRPAPAPVSQPSAKPPETKDEGETPDPPRVVLLGLVTIEARDLLLLEIPAVRFACAGLIVEGLNILAGRPKLGKSWIALQLGLASVTDTLFLGRVVEQGEVLYLALEDGRRRLKARLKKLLGDAACPSGLHLGTAIPRVEDGFLAYLGGFLDAHPLVRLVIVDTLTKVRSAAKKNGDRYQEDSDLAGALQRFALDRSLALVCVAHVRKALADDFVDTVNATLGLAGAADGILVLERARGSNEATLKAVGRDFEEVELGVSFSKETCTWSFIGPAAQVALSGERRAVLEVLRAATGSLTPAQIAAELGKRDSGSVRKLLFGMRKDGLVEPGVRYGTWMASLYV